MAAPLNSSPCSQSPKPSVMDVVSIASKSGTAGAAAMLANVSCLMWLRTTVKYQYRNGVSFSTAIRTLYADGGIPRFYRGVVPALVLAPLSRFGDTATNTGMPILLNSWDATKDLSVASKTFSASMAAATWRVCLMPVDTIETTMQVTGKFSNVINKVRSQGLTVLYHGSGAAASATLVGHFPWYFTYNYLSEVIPRQEESLRELGRRAILGFFSSLVSDTGSNSIRILKVNKQSAPDSVSYSQVAHRIMKESGVKGLLFRGLETKILVNGLQGIVFSVLWKHLEDLMNRK